MNRLPQHIPVLLAALLWTAAAARGREIEDATGRRVAVPDEPRRIASLCTSATDTLLRLGLTNRLAAIDEFSRIVPGAEQVPVMGKGSAISREQVIAAGVDLAFVWWYQDDAAALFRDLKVPVVRLRAARARETPALIRLIGSSVGATHAAGPLADQTGSALEALSAAVPTGAAPRVYIELYGAFRTAGRDTYVNDLIALAGGTNIAADAPGSLLISRERLIEADPDTICFVRDIAQADDFPRRPGLDQLAAIRHDRIFPIERYLLVAGPGLPAAVDALRRFLHHPPQRGD